MRSLMKYRQTELIRHQGTHVRLTGYGAASGMATHSHDHHQISFLLAGAIRERHDGREVETDLPSLCIKPAGLDHANDYGRDGAVILSVNIDPASDLSAVVGEDWSWRSCRPDRALSDLIGLLDEPEAEADAILTDLLALSGPAERKRGLVPDWLLTIRQRLSDPEDEADFAVMAREAGVHRVQASREFVRHFTIPPSVYRTRCRVSRALGLMAARDSLARVAAEAGFADQAHLCRAIKRQTGHAPSRLRHLMQAA